MHAPDLLEGSDASFQGAGCADSSKAESTCNHMNTMMNFDIKISLQTRTSILRKLNMRDALPAAKLAFSYVERSGRYRSILSKKLKSEEQLQDTQD
jgi:hypothetical protein